MLEWLIPTLIFIALLLGVWELHRTWVEARMRRRLAAVVPVRTVVAGEATNSGGWVLRLIQSLISFVAHLQQTWIPSAWALRIEAKLVVLPSWKYRSAAEWLVIKEGAALLGLGFGLIIGDLSLTLGAVVGAFFLPDLWLHEQTLKRRKAILRELPEFLDVLILCMNAGLALEPALQVILERGRKGPLYTELAVMMHAVRMGQSRPDAMQKMALSVAETDFTTFVNSFIQAERLGVSLAETLNAQVDQLRQKRSQYIEKLALEAPVKLLFPLIVFIFPVVFLVLFGPIVVRFMRGF